MKNFWVIAGLTVLVFVVAGIIYWFNFRIKPVKTTEEAIEVLTETPLPGVVSSNPLENKVPELNPVEKINPFKASYKNPFAP